LADLGTVFSHGFSHSKPDPEKIDPPVFLPAVQQYGKFGEMIAKAFQVGKE